jgi:hypothetical protein
MPEVVLPVPFPFLFLSFAFVENGLGLCYACPFMGDRASLG